MGTFYAQPLLQFYADSFETAQGFGVSLKTCVWFGYNPQNIFCYFFRNFNLVFFQALLLSTYVVSMYLVRVTRPIILHFHMIPFFFKTILAGT